jgi:hypothetical protein
MRVASTCCSCTSTSRISGNLSRRMLARTVFALRFEHRAIHSRPTRSRFGGVPGERGLAERVDKTTTRLRGWHDGPLRPGDLPVVATVRSTRSQPVSLPQTILGDPSV